MFIYAATLPMHERSPGRCLLKVAPTTGDAQFTPMGWKTHDSMLRLALAREAKLLEGISPADHTLSAAPSKPS